MLSRTTSTLSDCRLRCFKVSDSSYSPLTDSAVTALNDESDQLLFQYVCFVLWTVWDHLLIVEFFKWKLELKPFSCVFLLWSSELLDVKCVECLHDELLTSLKHCYNLLQILVWLRKGRQTYWYLRTVRAACFWICWLLNVKHKAICSHIFGRWELYRIQTIKNTSR